MSSTLPIFHSTESAYDAGMSIPPTRHAWLALCWCLAVAGTAWAQVDVLTGIKEETICSDTDDPYIDVPVNVCNVFVHLEEPSVKLLAVGYADITTDDPAGFFQHPFNFTDTAPSCASIPGFPSLVCDSFVTIGLKCDDGSDSTLTDPDFSTFEFNLYGHVVGGWFTVDPSNGQGLPGENGDVLVAQLAVTEGFDITGSFTAFVQGDFGPPLDCADFDGDDYVGPFDLVLLLGYWGACPGCPQDLNGDGTVDVGDLAWLLDTWGPCEDTPLSFEAFELEFSCFGSTCDMACDPGKTPENEPDCGIPEDTVNGGCNSEPPVFSPITCGESYCGTAQWNGTTRDTDWYELIVTEPLKEITWCATAEFDVAVGLVNTGGSGDCSDATALEPFAIAGPCEEACVTTIIGPGTWWLFVGAYFEGPPFACGAEYTATLTCLQEGQCGNDIVELGEDCDGTEDAACPGQCIPPGEPGECTCPCQPGPGAPPNDCCAEPLPILDGLTPFDTTGANTDGPPNPAGVCNDFGENQTHHDIWYNYVATCTGELTVTTCADLGGSADYDTDLVVYDGCECPATVEAMLGCNDDDPVNPCGTAPPWASTVTVSVVAGNCYKVRVGGWSGADEGTGVLNITCVCSSDPDCDDGDPCTSDTCVAGACDNSPADCNDNGTPDCDDIAEETSADCNGNSIPDECEEDCNANGVADECELAGNDCNENNVPDDCDIADGTSSDCDGSGVPDECEFLSTVLFVNDDGDPANACGCWAEACPDLQTALAKAQPGDEIWVAQGTYAPAVPAGPREATFQLQNGVALYGGFAGFETSLEERVGLFDQTILTGDLGGDDADVPCTQNFPDCDTFGNLCVDNVCIIRDNNTENSFHVVTGSGTDPTAILDGFTITAGNANGSQPDNQGGGMFNDGGNPTVINCTFTANSAENSGGGMTNRNNSSPTLINCTFTANSTDNAGGGMINFISSNPTVTDCTFSGNRAGSRGGGMTNEVNSSPTLTDCTFNGNSSTSGGGMSNNDSSPTLTNCAFIRNGGGGMNNVNNSDPTLTNCAFIGNSAGIGGGMSNIIGSEPTLTNCIFSGNSADIWGGGMFNHSTSLTLTNCTFSGNSAASEGGGMFNTSFSTPAVSNSIFWQNSDAGGMDESAQIHVDSGAPVVNYSLVQGGWTGAGGIGNLDADPLLADADGADDMVGTEDDDLRLSAGSPCVDSANNNAVPADTTDLDDDGDTIEPIPFDLDGESRFIDDANTPDCPQKGANCGTPPIVDMGAYEFGSDCNGNGLPDVCDLDCGAKGGACNLPGCGLSSDCNGNGLPDECEVPPLGPPEGDCNDNGVPDECDIADMTSDDCNVNGIPDECEFDCNGNGKPDDCDVDPADPDGNGEVSDDCNGNGIPDECEVPPIGPPENDCNDNGKPDECDVDPADPDGNGEVSDDCNGNGTPDECELPVSSGGLCTEGCASDCDGNGTIDSCDLAGCPPDTPFCDDCNVNGTLDGCDVDPLDPDGDGQVSADDNEDGVPDECIEATGTGEWSGDIWGLGGDYPDNDPKNPAGVPDLSVTLDGENLTVFADVTVEIPSLRLINGASLDVTQAEEQGDLTIFDPNGGLDGNLLIQGTLTVGGDRLIDAAGEVTIGGGGTYKSVLGFNGPVSAVLRADSLVVKCGGSTLLQGSMGVETGGDIVLSGDDKGDCTPPDFDAGDDTSATAGGDFVILGSADIEYSSSVPLQLGGDFDNQSTEAEIFDWRDGGIRMNGPLHLFEAAGEDRGPWPAGLVENFAIGTLTLAAETNVQVVDTFDNQQDGEAACDEALYVELLVVGPGSVLLTEGCRVYYVELLNEGSIPDLGKDVLQILEPCLADLNGDGIISAADLAMLLGSWGPCPGCPGDLNGDGIVSAADLAILLGSWGSCT